MSRCARAEVLDPVTAWARRRSLASRLSSKRIESGALMYYIVADVAHYISDYTKLSGIMVPTRHRIFPRSPDGQALSEPLVIQAGAAGTTRTREGATMSASRRVPPDPSSNYRAIENLITAYAELVDGGDFAGLGTLLADATFIGGGAPVSGADAIEKLFGDTVIAYDDGTPRTRHITSNIAIEVDESAGTAASRAYFTALQAVPGLTLQPIASGRYHDRFERRDGHWRFAERRVHVDLVGDVSRHLRRAR
jgi:SnoaL-like domain